MAKGIITVESGKGAPLRVAPDASAKMLGALKQGTQLNLLGYGDGWYLVEVNGIRGYVAGSMVQALDGIEGLGKLKIFGKKGKTAKPTVVNAVSTKAITASKDYKQMLTNLIKKAKSAGLTEDEIKQMASLNGIGKLTDLQGVDGLKDLVKKVGSGIKNAAQKVVGTSKQITETADAVNNAKEAINNAQAQQQATTTQAAAPAQQVVTINPNNNIQNQSTMTDESKEKLKKGLKIAGIVGGAAVATVVAVKLIKKNKKNAAKGALNGVSKKRRKKSRKSKKNTGNKMLNLK